MWKGSRGRGEGGRKEKVAIVIMCGFEWNHMKALVRNFVNGFTIFGTKT
jgi:hypothetical protein